VEHVALIFQKNLPELAPSAVQRACIALTGCRDINGPVPPSLWIRVFGWLFGFAAHRLPELPMQCQRYVSAVVQICYARLYRFDERI
jgi:hypothetical protein